MFKNLALLAVAGSVAIGLAEASARFGFRHVTTTADNRSYFAMKWKRENVRLNSLGYREREFASDKPAGAYRIAFVGDSFAFGQGIPEADRMSNVLGTALNGRSEVLNFGRAGNNTADELALLRTLLPTVKPDFVLLQWFVNDVEIPKTGGNSADAPVSRSRVSALKMKARNTSVLYFLAAETWHDLATRMGYGRDDEVSRRFSNPDSEASHRADAALLDLFRLCQAHHVPVGAVLVPHFGAKPGKDYAFGYLHDRVLASCARERVTCVDLRSTFEQHVNGRTDGYRSLWVNLFDAHMSVEANRLAAARVLEVFGPVWRAARP